MARALVRLTRRPSARTHIGAPAIPGIVAHALAPQLLTRSMMWAMERAMDRAGPAAITSGNLFDASRGTSIDGGFKQAFAKPKAWALGATAALVATVILGHVVRRGRHRT